jgi:anti-anti-sigma factor
MTTVAAYKLVGRLDGANAAVHEQALLALLTGDVNAVTIDLSELNYVSSAGLRVLLVTAKATKARGGVVSLKSPKPAILDVLRISGFDKILQVQA